MAKLRKSHIDENDLLLNPLIAEDFYIYVNKVKDKRSFTRDEEKIWDYTYNYFEREKITKVYTKTDNLTDKIAKLKTSGRELYLYLIYKIDLQHDWILIDKQHYMSLFNVSYNTYKNAIINLCENLVICPTAKYKDVYFINPRLFFSGSRLRKYETQLKLYKPKKKQKDT